VSAKPAPPKTLPDSADVRAVLAYNIRLRRVGKGWSQELLAFECGLDRTYVSAVERCTWNVSLGNIEKLAAALGCAAWELIKPPEDSVMQK
jgi:transcriptional regulator with XRE-family HTH domain